MSGPSSPAATEEQRRLAGRYLLQRAVGRGGAGVVWQARDELLGRTVAVKECMLPPTVDDADRDKLLSRVMREARTAARLDHPALVTVFDVVQESGQPWIVMEYVDSRSLSQVVRQDGPLPVAQVVDIGLALLDALRVAHGAGVLHRDVKPANVLLTESGSVVLTDFGIAASTGDPTLTTSGMLLGSPSYMPPERARGEVATTASDLWSWAATMYTLVEGTTPYSGDHPLAVLSAVADHRRRPMELAGPLESLLAGILDTEPDDRPGELQVQRQLERIRAELAAQAGPATTGGTPIRSVATLGGEKSAAERTARLAAQRPHRNDAAGAAGAGAAVAPGGAAPAGTDGPQPEAGDRSDQGSRPSRWQRLRGRSGAGAAGAAGVAGAAAAGAAAAGSRRPGVDEDSAELADELFAPSPQPDPSGPAAGGSAAGASAPEAPAPTAPDPIAPDPTGAEPPATAPTAPDSGSAPVADSPAGPVGSAPSGEQAANHPEAAVQQPPTATAATEPAAPPAAPATPPSAPPVAPTAPADVAVAPSRPNGTAPAAPPVAPSRPGAPGTVQQRSADGRRRRTPVLLGALALLVAALVVVGLVLRGGGEEPTATPGVPAPSAGAPGTGSSGSGDGSSEPSTSASPSASASNGTGAAVPAGWQTYRDERFGWTIGVPPEFQRSSRSGNQTDFRDSSGRLLRVEIAPQANESAIGDWREYEPSFRRQVSGYERIRIEPADGADGVRAADWEFTFRGGSSDLHVLNRGVIDGRTAHALYWQTPDSSWESSQEMRDQIFSTFTPPPQ